MKGENTHHLSKELHRLTNDNIISLVSASNNTATNTHYYYYLDAATARALVITASSYLTISCVTIRDTAGIGLTVIGVYGDSLIEHALFHNNSYEKSTSPPPVDSASKRTTEPLHLSAGGALLYFPSVNSTIVPLTERHKNNYNVVFRDCVFTRSESTSMATHYSIREGVLNGDQSYLRSGDKNTPYPLDGAAGLSIIFQDLRSNASVTVSNSTFSHSLHPDGGCLLVLYRDQLAPGNILIEGTSFENCSTKKSGGGMLLGFTAASSLSQFVESKSDEGAFVAINALKRVVLRDVVFTDCYANWGGGVAVISIPSFAAAQQMTTSSAFFPQAQLPKKLSFQNCTWRGNTAGVGSAVALWEGKYHGLQSQDGLRTTFMDTTFKSNAPLSTNLHSSAVVSLNSVESSFEGETLFDGNSLTCIGATRSVVHVFGEFDARRTSVITGGVLEMRDSSFFVLAEGARVRFAHNSAVWRGGAVDVTNTDPWPFYQLGHCFLHFREIEVCEGSSPCYNLSDDEYSGRYHISFDSNSANLYGSEVFGNGLYACPWSGKISGVELLERLQNDWRSVIEFSDNVIEINDTINNYLDRVELQTPIPESVMPGQIWKLNVTTYDSFNQTVPTLVTILTDSLSTTTQKIDGSTVSLIESENKELEMNFTGAQDTDVTFHFLSISNFQPVGSYHLRFSECKVGFVFNNLTNTCECEQTLEGVHSSVECLPNGLIRHEPLRWVGYRLQQQQKTKQEDDEQGPLNNSYCLLYSSSLCIFDYCNADGVTISDLKDASEQCNYNRSGVLCGGCRDGYSRSFGSTECLRCGFSTLFYLPVMAVTGFLIVAAIFLFKLTVTNGYLSGPVCFSNIAVIYEASIFPSGVSRSNSVLFAIMSLFNLEFSFGRCLYDGMTQLQLSAMRILFPFYLLFLVGAFVLFARCSPKSCNKLYQSRHFRPVQAVATVLFLSFTNLLKYSFEVLGLVSMRYVGPGSGGGGEEGCGNKTEYRWLLDPNVEYGRGFHGVLVFVALFLIVFLLAPQVIFLLLYKPLLKVFCIKTLLQKWWPLFDAYQSAFRDRLRFWIGVQLLFRVTALLINNFQHVRVRSAGDQYQLRNGDLFVMVMFLASFFFIQATLRPFKGWIQNLLDSTFLLNLFYMLTSSLYYSILLLSTSASDEERNSIRSSFQRSTDLFLGFAVTLTILILLGFMFVKLGGRRVFICRLFPKLPSRIQKAARAIIQDMGIDVEEYQHRHASSSSKTEKTASLTATKEISSVEVTVLGDGVLGTKSSRLSPDYFTRYRESLLAHEDNDS